MSLLAGRGRVCSGPNHGELLAACLTELPQLQSLALDMKYALRYLPKHVSFTRLTSLILGTAEVSTDQTVVDAVAKHCRESAWTSDCCHHHYHRITARRPCPCLCCCRAFCCTTVLVTPLHQSVTGRAMQTHLRYPKVHS